MNNTESNQFYQHQKNNSLQCAKDELREVILSLEYLKKTRLELEQSVRKLSAEEWDCKIREVDTIKQEVTEKLSKYDDKTLGVLKTRSKERECKRKRIRLRKIRMQSEREKALSRRKESHNIIDTALETEKQKIEKEKKIKEAANYAQLVLSNVTAKKSDAEEYIQLFNCLKELRRLRKATYQRSDTHSGCEFDAKINRLVAVWNDAFEEYENEEKKLKLILNDAHTSSEDQWHELLFGGKSKDVMRLDSIDSKDFNRFLEIRYGWDSCIVPDDWPFGSYIPKGWALPPVKPSSAWKMYRK